MVFNKPCLRCGVLSKDSMCRNCHRGEERIRDRKRDADPARKLKKATYTVRLIAKSGSF